MYQEMQQLVHDDCGQIVIVFNNYVEAALEEARSRSRSPRIGRSMA